MSWVRMAQNSPPASVRQESMGAPMSARSAAPYGDASIVPPLTPGGSVGRTQPLRRPQHNESAMRYERHVDESSMQLENPEANLVMGKRVFGYVILLLGTSSWDIIGGTCRSCL